LANLIASELAKIPPGPERDKYYDYPYAGPYNGEPTQYEILHEKEFRELWGKDSLAISHECPHCSSKDTEWFRQAWCVCFDCIATFTLQDAIDFQIFLDEEYEKEEIAKLMRW